MASATDVLGAVAEVFTWVGLGAGVLLAILAGILTLADGTWLPVRGVVEPDGEGHLVRWIDVDGEIGEAPLSDAQFATLRGADMADILYRQGTRDRMRMHPGSPAARALGRLAVGFLGLGIVSSVFSLVMLFVEG